jgi:hypothetical protein
MDRVRRAGQPAASRWSARLADEILRLQGTPQYQELLLKTAMEPLDPIPLARMPEFVRAEHRRWGAAIKASGATIE